MRKTKCKVFSSILTLVFLLANVPVLTQAAVEEPALAISYTRFADAAGAALTAMPAMGTDIQATVGVRKSGQTAVNAALYLAQYAEDGRLTAIGADVQNMNLAQDERILSVKSKVAEGTAAMKALLWDGNNQSPMICTGNFPAAGSGLSAVYIDGVLFDEYNENVFSYYKRLEGNDMPKVTAVTQDSSISAQVSYTYGELPAAQIKVGSADTENIYTIYFQIYDEPRITNLQLLTDAVQTQPSVVQFENEVYMYSDSEVNAAKFLLDKEQLRRDYFDNCYLIQPGSDWEKSPQWIDQDRTWGSFDINQTAEIYLLTGGYEPGTMVDGGAMEVASFNVQLPDGTTQTKSYRVYRYEVPVKPGEIKTVDLCNKGVGPNKESWTDPVFTLVKFKDIFDVQYNGSYKAPLPEKYQRILYDANLQTGSLTVWDRMRPDNWGFFKFGYLDPRFVGATYIRPANGDAGKCLSYPEDSTKDAEGISFKVTSDVDVYLLYREWLRPAYVDQPDCPWEYTTNAAGYAQMLNADGGHLTWFKAMAYQHFTLEEGEAYRQITLPNTGYIAVIKKAGVSEPKNVGTISKLQYQGPEPDRSENPDDPSKPFPAYKNAARFIKGIKAGDLAYQDRENIFVTEITDQLGFTDAYYLQVQLDNKNTGNPAVYNYYAEPDKPWFTFEIDAPADIIMLTTRGYAPPAVAADETWIRQAPLAEGSCYADIRTATSSFQPTHDTMYIKSVDVLPGETQTVTIPTMGSRTDLPIILVRFK